LLAVETDTDLSRGICPLLPKQTATVRGVCAVG
jgi:hypothetical protein